MAVIRVHKNHDYTVISNRLFREKGMSLKAKGLLALMLSLPDTWDYSISGLVAICKENESSIKTGLNELKEFGYLEIIKQDPSETKSGRIEYVYNIYESPKQEREKQEVEKQGVENQPTENQGQLNTKESITKEVNTKDNINVQILDYLNKKAGKRYKDIPSNLKHINARLKEGYKIEDFKKVVDLKIMQWGNDKIMKSYIRPKTLFSENFDSYLNETMDNENLTQTEAESLSSETREKLKNASTPQERISILRDSLRNTEDDIYF